MLLGEPYHLQEQGDLVPLFVGRGTVPVGMMLGQWAGVRKWLRWLILDVEPLSVPRLVRIPQVDEVEVLCLAPLAQLEGRTFDNGSRVWLHMKEMAPQVEMGIDPRESFAEMDVDGDLKNGIRVEMDQL